MNAVLNMPVAPRVSVPSIASSAVLIELSISVWTGRKQDKNASEKVTTDANAKKGVAKVSKALLGDCDELIAVQKFAANARNSHYSMTMPWSDTGLRLCPLPIYINKYEQAMSGLQQEFSVLVDKFLQAYEWEKSEAQVTLGDLFNADEYPSADALRNKFKFRYTAMPVMESGDFRLDIANEATRAMAEQYEKFYKEQLGQAMRNVWDRLDGALSKMSERLDYSDTETKKRFHDTLVSNVLEIVQLMGDCNLTNDPHMSRAQQDLELALRNVTADALREDAHLRRETKAKADEVRRMIDALPSLL